MTSNAPASPWGQPQLSLWLSRRRMDRLRRIAATLPPGSTPLDSIDRALDLATAPFFVPNPNAEHDDADSSAATIELSALEARLAAISARSEQALFAKIDRLASMVNQIGEQVASLRATVLAATQSDDEELADESGPETAQNIGQWLRVRLAVAGQTVKEFAIVHATARASSRLSGPASAMEFDTALSTVDGREFRDSMPPAPIRVAENDAMRKLSQLKRGEQIRFVCRPLRDGVWNVDVHLVDATGAVGLLAASFVAR